MEIQHLFRHYEDPIKDWRQLTQGIFFRALFLFYVWHHNCKDIFTILLTYNIHTYELIEFYHRTWLKVNVFYLSDPIMALAVKQPGKYHPPLIAPNHPIGYI